MSGERASSDIQSPRKPPPVQIVKLGGFKPPIHYKTRGICPPIPAMAFTVRDGTLNATQRPSDAVPAVPSTDIYSQCTL